jgi:hypothetical protein
VHGSGDMQRTHARERGEGIIFVWGGVVSQYKQREGIIIDW